MTDMSQRFTPKKNFQFFLVERIFTLEKRYYQDYFSFFYEKS